MATFITVEEGVTEVQPENGTDFTLEELQKFVGGYIQVVRLEGSQRMVVNEEGLIIPLLFNKLATELAGQFSVGNVLVIENDQMK